jgi:predicted MFS family arabinose efflux permease
MTIFIVVAVLGLVVGFAQSRWLPQSPHSAEVVEPEPEMKLAVDLAQPES